MVKILYTILLVGTAGGVGLTAVCAWLNIKLYTYDKDRRRKSLTALLVGMGLQNGILSFALIDAGTIQVSWRGFFYTIGLLISTAALSWKAGQFVGDLALLDSQRPEE